MTLESAASHFPTPEMKNLSTLRVRMLTSSPTLIVLTRQCPYRSSQGSTSMPMSADLHAVLCNWHRRAREAAFAHYAGAERYRRYNLALGIPAMLLSTIVGTTVFASLQQTFDPRLQIAV